MTNPNVIGFKLFNYEITLYSTCVKHEFSSFMVVRWGGDWHAHGHGPSSTHGSPLAWLRRRLLPLFPRWCTWRPIVIDVCHGRTGTPWLFSFFWCENENIGSIMDKRSRNHFVFFFFWFFFNKFTSLWA